MSQTITLTDTHMDPNSLHGQGSNHLNPIGATGDLNAKPVTKQDDKSGFFANLFNRKKPVTPQTSTPLISADEEAYEPIGEPVVVIDNDPSKAQDKLEEAPRKSWKVTLGKIVTGRTDRTAGTVSPTYAKINRVLDRLTNAETNGVSNRLQVPGTNHFLLREFEIERAVVQTILKSLNVLKSGSEYFVADGKVGIVNTALLTALAGLVRGIIFIVMRATTAVATLAGVLVGLAGLAIGGIIMLIGLALKHVVYPLAKFLVKLTIFLVKLVVLLIPTAAIEPFVLGVRNSLMVNGITGQWRTPLEMLMGSIVGTLRSLKSDRKQALANTTAQTKANLEKMMPKQDEASSQGSPSVSREESRPDSSSGINIENNTKQAAS